jgi:hypothetical protein
MAYDPNCTETKAAIKAAVEAALEELRQEHEDDIAGLKAKNKDLIQKLSKARQGSDEGEVARLEAELEKVQAELVEAKKALKVIEKDLKTATDRAEAAEASAATEANISREMLVGGGLTQALVGVNVPAKFLPAVTAMLKGKVEIKEEGGERKAFVGDKSLGDFIKEWSQSDEGKVYVEAPGNGGGGANGSGNGGPAAGKKLSDMTEAERVELAKTNKPEFDRLVAEDRKAKAAVQGQRYN